MDEPLVIQNETMLWMLYEQNDGMTEGGLCMMLGLDRLELRLRYEAYRKGHDGRTAVDQRRREAEAWIKERRHG